MSGGGGGVAAGISPWNGQEGGLITVLWWNHTILKDQQAPRGNKPRSITDSLQKLTASICACGQGLSH